MRRSGAGHIDLASVFWVWLILGAIAAEFLYRHYTGNSLASLVNWWWVVAGVGAIVSLIALGMFFAYKRIRVETVGDKTIVHFGRGQFERLPEPPEVERGWTGGAFGQPARRWITLKRGGEVIWHGPAHEGERLLAALTQQPLAGGDAPKV